jgi:hypothetical protein
MAVLYWPPLSQGLGTGPIAPCLVGLAALGGPVLFFADWMRKRVSGH